MFDLVAGPGLEVVGSVRDKDTGKPLAGATVQNTASFRDWPLRFLKTSTDDLVRAVDLKIFKELLTELKK